MQHLYHGPRKRGLFLIRKLESRKQKGKDTEDCDRLIRRIEMILFQFDLEEGSRPTSYQFDGYLAATEIRSKRYSFLRDALDEALEQARTLVWRKDRTDLSVLEVSTRIENALRSNGFESVQELIEANPADLYVPMKFGKGLLAQLAEAVRKHRGLIPTSWRKELGLS